GSSGDLAYAAGRDTGGCIACSRKQIPRKRLRFFRRSQARSPTDGSGKHMTAPNNPAAALEAITRRYFIWIIAFSYLAAGLWPGFGLWIRNFEIGSISIFQTKLTLFLAPMMLGLLLFNTGLGVEAGELRNLLRKPLILLGGVFGNVTVPLAFITA